MLLSIPPNYAVFRVTGYMKGKNAINIARTYLGEKKNFRVMYFWVRRYFVSTVGFDEVVIGKDIQKHEKEDKRVKKTVVI
jgi:putative transposase